MFRIILPLLALTLFLAPPAFAAQKIHRVDTSAILASTLEKANAGDAMSQYVMGIRYERGQDVKQSFAQSNDWFRKAAEQGLSMAELKLADHCQYGKGMTVNLADAAAWYGKAAAQDNFAAQHQLGRLYLSGDGVKQDFVEGYFWLSLAAGEQQYAADRDRSANLLKPDQIAAVKARVEAWRKEKAAKAAKAEQKEKGKKE